MVAVTFFPVAEAAPLGEEPEVEAFPRSVRSGQNSHSISYDTSLPLTTVFMSLPLPAIVLQALSDCDREASEKSGPKKSSRSRRKGWGVWGSHESGESDGTSSSTPTRTSLSLSLSFPCFETFTPSDSVLFVVVLLYAGRAAGQAGRGATREGRLAGNGEPV